MDLSMGTSTSEPIEASIVQITSSINKLLNLDEGEIVSIN